MKRYAVDLPDVEKQAGPPNQGADFSWQLGATKNKARLSWRPYASGNSVGSSKRRDRDITQLHQTKNNVGHSTPAPGGLVLGYYDCR
jgi:hypothetical protein